MSTSITDIDWAEVDWYAVRQAQRQMLDDVVRCENEAIRIDRTTYAEKNSHYLNVLVELRQCIDRYSAAVTKAGIPR